MATDVVTAKTDFYTKAGAVCTAKQWADAASGSQETVALDTVEVNKENITIFSRYSGLDHGGGKIWELGVDGNPKNEEHKQYVGHHEIFATKEELAAAHGKAVDIVKSGKPFDG